MAEFESCDKCRYSNKSDNEYPCNKCVHSTTDKFKPKTRADVIRSMNDEELADMLHNIGSYVEKGEPLIDIYIGENKSTIDDSFGFILEWLQSEAE